MKFVYIPRGRRAYGEKGRDRGYIPYRVQYGYIGEYLFIGGWNMCV